MELDYVSATINEEEPRVEGKTDAGGYGTAGYGPTRKTVHGEEGVGPKSEHGNVDAG